MAHEPLVSFFFSSRRRHTRFDCDWSSDVCSSDLVARTRALLRRVQRLQPAPTASAAPADALFSIDPQGQRVRMQGVPLELTRREYQLLRCLLERPGRILRSEEHTSELQSQSNLVCRLLLEKKKKS